MRHFCEYTEAYFSNTSIDRNEGQRMYAHCLRSSEITSQGPAITITRIMPLWSKKMEQVLIPKI